MDGAYVLDGALGDSLDGVAPGTNLLVVGDEAGTANLVYRVLAPASRYQESVVLVSTTGTTASVVEAYRSHLTDPEDLDHLHVVDASHSGLERDTGPLSPTRVEAAKSPADVTGIGVGITNHLRSTTPKRVRLGMVSLSPVVDRLGPEQAFAFFHVLTSRVRNADHVGLFAIDSGRHGEEQIRILQSLVDGTLAFRTTDDGRRVVSGAGVVEGVAVTVDSGDAEHGDSPEDEAEDEADAG
jgi:KaiC/GvpD/RAD55 family RecA-like ATPase